MKPMEAYEKVDNTCCLNSLKYGIDVYDHSDCISAEEMVECLEVIEEAIEVAEWTTKALDIIKEKRVDIDLFLMSDNAEDYNKYCPKYINVKTQLTQEEYDFLKEILS